VFALVVDGGCETTDFLMDLPLKVRLQMEANVRWLGDQGFIHNQQKLNRLEPGIYEVKTKDPAERLFCFQDGRDWVCTHGARKPGKRELPSHIAKVRKLRQRWLEERR